MSPVASSSQRSSPGLRDGHLSAGDKWEIVAAVAAALGVFAVPNKPAAGHRRAVAHNAPEVQP
jgi:hypothetical protein